MEAFAQLINLPELIASAIGFLIFAGVLLKFLWKPVLQVIDDRRASIEQAFAEVDAAKEEVARLKTEYEAHLKQIQAEAQQKMQEAVARGQQIAQEIRADSEAQRERLLLKTREDIVREKEMAVAELRNAAIDLSFTISRRVMKEGLQRPQHDALVASFIDELKELK